LTASLLLDATGEPLVKKSLTSPNIVLQALPIDGKIVLREPQADDRAEPADTKKDNVASLRGVLVDVARPCGGSA
jgi:hypothetical protein